MSRFVLVAPYTEMAELARKIARESGEDIEVIEGLLPVALDAAKKADRQEADAIIVRGGTAVLLRRAGVSVPVVEIPVTGWDVMRGVYEASKTGNRIAIIGFQNMIGEPEVLEALLQRRIEVFPLRERADVRVYVMKAREEGIEVVVGGMLSVEMARRYGLKGVLIQSGRESITEAISEAKRIAFVRSQEREKTNRFRTIMDYAFEGIIATDKDGRITVCNKAAEKILNKPAEAVLGRDVDDVIPSLKVGSVLRGGKPEVGVVRHVGEVAVTASCAPITGGRVILGAVATFHDITRLQVLEQQSRKELLKRGHVAKMSFDDIIGSSPAIRQAKARARQFAGADASVLITGETGTGKEMFAQSIHNASPRSSGPFVAINCAAVPETLLESELFGYAEGAFTGARQKGKPGLFEIAHGGTVFLDEVSDMAPRLQAQLLRVIQEREVVRIGDDRVIPVDVRVIAASNKDLGLLVASGEFRRDLYHRLNVLTLRLPSLRERPEDIPLLAQAFFERFTTKYRKGLSLSPDLTWAPLLSYSWPGNVRELMNVIERLVVLADCDKVTPLVLEELMSEIMSGERVHPAVAELERPLTDASRLFKRQLIEDTVRKCNGSVSKAAELLGVHRSTLWRHLNKYAGGARMQR